MQDLWGAGHLRVSAHAGCGKVLELGVDTEQSRAPGWTLHTHTRAARGDPPPKPSCLSACRPGSSRAGFAACHVPPCCERGARPLRAEVSEATGLSRQRENRNFASGLSHAAPPPRCGPGTLRAQTRLLQPTVPPRCPERGRVCHHSRSSRGSPHRDTFPPGFPLLGAGQRGDPALSPRS